MDVQTALHPLRAAPLQMSWRRALAAICVVAPFAVFLWFQADAGRNYEWIQPTGHFFVVTLVSLLATLVALLIFRIALSMAQYQVVLVTLGFVSLAGFFAVHAFATPGILFNTGAGTSSGGAGPYGMPGMPDMYGTTPYGSSGGASSAPAATQFFYSGTVVGLSAFLSLFVPSWLFAGSFAPSSMALARRRGASVLTAGVLVLLAAYTALSIAVPNVIANLPLSRPPFSYILAGAGVTLLIVAAVNQFRAYMRTQLPTQGALALAFVLLAEAQVLMALAPFWTVSWWGYHVLMFSAVVIALTALFVELDRRRGLERFVPRELVEGVVAGNLLRREGQRRTVTILFADLRNSTTVAEQLPAEEVVELLNDYAGAFARCVFAYGGMLDKFLGDGLMAIFGVSPDGDRSFGAVAAIQAALEMRCAVDEVNVERARQGHPAMQFGVALHTGEVVIGEIGIPQRSDFTAVGDTVNTAARMGDLNKEYGVDVVLSRETADRLPDGQFSLRELGEARVRGRRETVCAYTVA